MQTGAKVEKFLRVSLGVWDPNESQTTRPNRTLQRQRPDNGRVPADACLCAY